MRSLPDPLDALEIPGEGGPLRVILAIEAYSDEADPDAGRRHRSRTDVGVLLNRAKYHPGTLSADDAFAALVAQMTAIAQVHPACACASTVIATPGSDRSTEGFSEKLARDIGVGLSLPVVSVRSRIAGRRSAKEKKSNRAGDYVLEGQVRERVLVVDDVFESGTTLVAVAQAALEAGARECVGLVAARKLPLPSG